MSSMVSRINIVGDSSDICTSSCCNHFESEKLYFRRMEHGDLQPLRSIFNEIVNRQSYGVTEEKSVVNVLAMIERGILSPFFTGYLIESKITRELLGRGAIESGYRPKHDLDGAYKAAPLDECGGKGPAELQIDDFLVSEPSKLGVTGKSRPELYKEMLLTLLVVAKTFIGLGIEQNGQRVKRVIITVINPEKSGFSGVAQDDLVMRRAVIEEIFGKPAGILLPKSVDTRNYSEHQRDVYACEASGLEALLLKNHYA